MKRICSWAAVAVLCLGFVGCHGDSTAHTAALIKSIESVLVDSNTCEVTVCGTVRLGTREGLPVDTALEIALGNDGQSMDDLLASFDDSVVKALTLLAVDVDEDGCVAVCVTIDLPVGDRPVAVRASTSARPFTPPVAVGNVSGLAASPVTGLFCRVIDLDAAIVWSLGSVLPVEGIEVLLDGTIVATLPGDAFTMTLPGVPVGATVTVRTLNKYGSSEVSCRVARPGTPSLLCQLVGDLVLLTWESEANSVELFQDGASLGVFAGSGTHEVEDVNPGDYVYTAIGTGLGEEQPDAISDTASCELHRKARLILADRCDEQDVARVLLANEQSDVPVLLNAKLLTLDIGEVTASDGLVVEADRPRGSCFSVDSFFDIEYSVTLRDELREGTFSSIEVLATFNGEEVQADLDVNETSAEVELETCQPGVFELTINLSAEEEFEGTNESNEAVVETEIVALSLTATIPVLQSEHLLFGAGERINRRLRIPSACHADAFIDDQSNTGNRVVLVPDVVHGYGYGYGYGIGTASGWDYVHGLDVTGSAFYHDYLELYGGGSFFDNTSSILPWLGANEFIPVSVEGTTSGEVNFDLEASGWNYVSLPVFTGVHTEVNVWVPIISHEDVDADFVTYLAGRNAVGRPDCKAFGVGREAGHLTLAFIDNVIIDGPGYDLRIFERSTEDATEIFHGLLALDRFFVAQDPELQNLVPVDRDIELPTDSWAQDLTTPLGFVVYTESQQDYDCGYVIDVDLGVLADRLVKLIGEGAVPRPDCMNLLTVISDGAGNTVEGDLRELFFGADIDAVCGLNNRFGLRVLPTSCTEEEELRFTFRDLRVGGLFFDPEDQEQQEEQEHCRREKLWRYKLCAGVYCDGLKLDPLATNEVEVQSLLEPYHVRCHLKQNAVCGLARAADEAGEAFGLDHDD